MILYVNSCVRANSRTDKIARALLEKLGGGYSELKLSETKLVPLTRDALDERTDYINRSDFSLPAFDLAKQFARADIIVISAPFWDLSFPAALKVYIENIYVTGIVSRYGSDGMPVGLCSAKKLYYVTTAGGPYLPDYSYNYIRELAKKYLGIRETALISAQMLDVDGYDAEEIITETINNLKI